LTHWYGDWKVLILVLSSTITPGEHKMKIWKQN
jgi:hypothetical protein